MKRKITVSGPLGALFFLSVMSFWLFMVGVTVYGLYLAFSASILLGIVVLVVEPSPAIIGLVMLFFEKNLAQALIDYLNN